jgi:hypothetical protein
MTAAGHAQPPDGSWQLRVSDGAGRTRVEATIHFTEEEAKSCIGGTWKRIVVDKATASDEAFFPLAKALAYELKDGRLTLGRTWLCDGYLFMNGALAPAAIEGSYFAFGLGGRQPLGTFTLKKAD